MRKNQTLGFLRPQKSDEGRINCVPHGAIYALGIGSDLASPAPGGTGAKSAGVPHGLAPLTGPITTHTPPSRVRLCERTYPPEGGEGLARLVRSHSNKFRRSPSRVPYIWERRSDFCRFAQRANLASQIAGLFARTDAKIRALTRQGRFSVPDG